MRYIGKKDIAKSVGIALLDLTAASTVYECTKKIN